MGELRDIRNYKKKFVAFVDILGFKNLVANIESKANTHESDFRKVESILNYLDDESKESNGQHDLPVYEKTDVGYIERELGNPVITYVSDCVVISTDGTFDGFKSLCNKITKFSTDIATDGIFLRGAIVYGDLFHNGRILFGSAYQRAYELESTTAIYPRVIIDSSVYEVLHDYIGQHPLNKVAIVRDSIDNINYLLPFQFNYFPHHCGPWLDFMLRVKSHLLYHLNFYDNSVEGYSMDLRNLERYCCWKEQYTWELNFTGGNENIFKKYIWLKDEFNKAISTYAKFLQNEEGKPKISPIVFKNNHWGPEEILGHIR